MFVCVPQVHVAISTNLKQPKVTVSCQFSIWPHVHVYYEEVMLFCDICNNNNIQCIMILCSLYIGVLKSVLWSRRSRYRQFGCQTLSNLSLAASELCNSTVVIILCGNS